VTIVQNRDNQLNEDRNTGVAQADKKSQDDLHAEHINDEIEDVDFAKYHNEENSNGHFSKNISQNFEITQLCKTAACGDKKIALSIDRPKDIGRFLCKVG